MYFRFFYNSIAFRQRRPFVTLSQQFNRALATIYIVLLSSACFAAEPETKTQKTTDTPQSDMHQFCRTLGNTLGSVSFKDCTTQQLQDSRIRTSNDTPLVYKEYAPMVGREPLGRVLLMGGIHGDEYSSVSLMFRWMEQLNRYHSGLFHWQVIPLLNPDGLFKQPSATRQNSNGVDLNRNFPTSDWGQLAHRYWEERTYRNPRRYPGANSGSETETQWFIHKIQSFQPHAIVAVHAPHHLVDFDGPQSPPVKLGALQLRRLGTYPGSLGNYGGSDLDIPVLTLELPSAGIMPSQAEISQMWLDLVRWLQSEVPKQRAARQEKQQVTTPPVVRNP